MNKINKKDLIGIATLVMSAVGIVLGFVSKTLIFGTFTAGTWLCFAAFLMSMAAVKDHGSNRLAASAFFITFLSAFVTIYLATEM